MVRKLIDFSGIGVFDILGISEKRAIEIYIELDKLVQYITNNYEEYIYKVNDDDGIHVGKVLDKILENAKTYEEELLCLINLDVCINKIMNAIIEERLSYLLTTK